MVVPGRIDLTSMPEKKDFAGERHHAGDGEALHQHREHVLYAHQPGVKESAAGKRHEEHQDRGGEHPGRVRRIQLRRCGWRRLG